MAAQEADGTLVVLVRHAERADDHPTDPGLSPEGLVRAETLARMLADANLTALWTTDYRRTRQTAAPVADATGLEVQVYAAGGEDLAAFAERLRTTPGRHLVIGHSNTTSALASALGGEPGDPIDEGEYDRLYVLVIGGDGGVSTTLFRFGSGGRRE
jgi:broad specificity phosphatase PhoE